MPLNPNPPTPGNQPRQERCRKPRLIAIDIEGTGCNPPEPIQIALVEIEDDRATDRTRVWFIRPTGPMNPFAVKKHGIKDKVAAHFPTFAEQEAEIRAALEGATLVGHAIGNDLILLRAVMPDWTPKGFLCTQARIRRKTRQKMTLVNACAAYGIDEADAIARVGGRSHDALTDAMMTAMLHERLQAAPNP